MTIIFPLYNYIFSINILVSVDIVISFGVESENCTLSVLEEYSEYLSLNTISVFANAYNSVSRGFLNR